MCQCGLGGRIAVTVLPVPGAPPVGPEGVGGLAALQEQQRQQDAAAHELAAHAKEQAGKLALLGIACAIGGIFFPPLELVAVVALEASEVYLVVGIAVDVAVAIDHPTQDNWVAVGADVVAVAAGYVVGKVVVGRLMTAFSNKLAQHSAQKAAAELEALAAAEAKTATAKVAAEKLAAAQSVRTAQLAAAHQAAKEVAALGAKGQLATQEEAAAIYKLREDLRAENAGLSEGANVATAKGTIDGKQIDLKANSSKTTGKGTVPHKLPVKQQLKTQPNLKDLEKNARPDTFRAYDSEVKILEKVLDDTTPESTGEIIITSLNDFCNSCENAIDVQMSKLRPGIKIIKVYVQPYRNK